MEEFHHQRKQRAHCRAHEKGKTYLTERFKQHCLYGQLTADCKDLCKREAYGKDDKADSIIECRYGQKRVRDGTTGLVLTHDQQRCGRRSRSSYCAEQECSGYADICFAGHQKHRAEHDEYCCDCLYDGNNKYGFSQLFEITQLEFSAYGECDEAESHRGDDFQALNALDIDDVENIWADEDAGDKVARNVGQVHELHDPR